MDVRGEELAALNTLAAGAAAHRYAELGWQVVPVAWMADGSCGCRQGPGCAHPAKHPLSRGGLKAASADPARIAEWWGHWPAAGVGIVTGSRSGVVVVDVDPGHGGNDSLNALREAGLGLPRTLYARTGGGGWHLFYAAPETPVANSIGRLGRRELPGIDLRGEEGYVVAAPSGHRSGGRYEWAATTDALTPMPAWVLERPDVVRSTTVPQLSRADRRQAYAANALDGECQRVATAPEGQRNAILNRAAFSLGTLVGAGALDEHVAVEALTAAAASASQAGAQPMREREVMATIRSGLREGMRRPRSLDGGGGSMGGHPGRSPTGHHLLPPMTRESGGIEL